MTKTQSLLLLALAAFCALALAVAGCGGDDSAEASLTKAQFVKRAEAICEESEKEQVEDIVAYRKKNPKAEEVEVVSSVGLLSLEEQLRQMKGLSAPSGDEATVDLYLKAFEEGLEEAKDDPASVLGGKEANPFAEANLLAKRYGMKACAFAP